MDGQAFGQMENSSTNEGLNSAEKAFYYFEKYDFFSGNFNWDSWISEFFMK